MPKKIKVMHFINSFSTGGAEKVVLSYLHEFKSDTIFEMSAVSLAENRHKIYDKLAENEGLKIRYLGCPSKKNTIIERITQIIHVRSVLKLEKPDIIHMHLSLLNIVSLASIGLGIRVKFHTIHSNPRYTSKGIYRYINTLYYKLFGVKTIALNAEMKKYADDLFFRNDTIVIPNGIYLSDYNNSNMTVVKKELGISNGLKILGHIGRFAEVKNHKKIIDVFQELRKIDDSFILILIGEGSLMETIREDVKAKGLTDYVHFLGSRDDVPHLLQGFDLFIFPSLYEGLGIVLIEAQAAGIKCLVSDKIPKEAIVSNLVTSISLDETAKHWAERLIQIDASDCEKQYTNIDYYSMENVAKTLKSVYLDSLNND